MNIMIKLYGTRQIHSNPITFSLVPQCQEYKMQNKFFSLPFDNVKNTKD